jgi:hypothetical protein
VTPIESFRANSPDYKPLVVQPALTTAASAESAPAGGNPAGSPATTGAPIEAHPTENHAPAGAPAQVHP